MKKVLVTGGGGFVGNALVETLLRKGILCRVAGRHTYPHLQRKGVCCCSGDISDPQFAAHITRGIDTVFHVASFAGIWGKYEAYRKTNITGTENIISASLANGVKHLVYTSTPSVVFNQKDICGESETLPYTTSYLCNYARTKVEAEKIVLSVEQNKLVTTALRPHLIWGPGDPHLVPRLLDRAKKGKIRQVGSGANLVDITYIDNVVHAHILAAQELENGKKCAGKAYFIGQERPVILWEWINDLLTKMQIPPVTRKVPFLLAYGGGALLEVIHKVCVPHHEPLMTRFLAEQLAKNHYFRHDNAQRDFSYSPVVSIEEGMERLIIWLKGNEKAN